MRSELLSKSRHHNINGAVTWKLSFFADSVKNYRSASLLACRQSLLVLSSNGRAKARVARAWVASTQMARGQVPRYPSPMWQERSTSQESKSFVLRTYIVDGMGVKKLHID